MKEYVAHVVKSIMFSVVAESKKDAEKKVKDIFENTDLLNRINTEDTTAFKIIEPDSDYEDPCPGDCDDCPYSEDDECLLDEMY